MHPRVKKGIKTITYNESSFQTDNSDSCGLFVIYFIWQRMFNLDLNFTRFYKKMPVFWTKLTVFEAKSSEIGPTKTAMTAKVANFF